MHNLKIALGFAFVLTVCACGRTWVDPGTVETMTAETGGGSGGTEGSGGSSASSSVSTTSTGGACGGVEVTKGCAQADACCPTLDTLAAHCAGATNNKLPIPHLCVDDSIGSPCVQIETAHVACSWISDALLFCCPPSP